MATRPGECASRVRRFLPHRHTLTAFANAQASECLGVAFCAIVFPLTPRHGKLPARLSLIGGSERHIPESRMKTSLRPNRRGSCVCAHAHAVTLVELLVVMGIIALLIG